MKKLFVILSAIILLAGSATVYGQAKITTRKMKLSDFPTKTTKVVLAGNEILNTALQSEVSRRWMASPYEFCTQEEYEANKTNSNYYFLIPVSSRFKKEAEPGIVVLSLIKGGPSDSTAEKNGFEVVSIPCCSLEGASGREFVFLPALLDIIQNYVTEAMSSDRVGYTGLAGLSGAKILREGKKKIVFADTDLAPSVAQDESWQAKNIEALDEDDADQIFSDGAPATLVSYVVAPDEPQKGSVCYKMIISADTHELCFFEKHQIKGSAGAGFLPADIKLIMATRKNR